ncbi:MAG: metallophosphoesterase [Gordonia sp. (in: high G+C Gram-positive bacteria)]|uniref:metallophosphoesterase n=1 Tax=Gordonia sp. (in: high G+C Gram-positive bacteria) TaxID=84139 RepID=UPI003BB4B525
MVVVAQISDLHFNGTPAHRDRISAVLDYVHSTVGDRVAALLVTGDLTNDGTAREYAEAAAHLQSHLPILTLLGNHDDRAAYTTIRDGAPCTDPVNSVVRLEDLLIVGLDSSIPGESAGRLEETSLAWARAQIAAAGEVDVLLTWHHPPADLGMPHMDSRKLHDVERAAALVTDHPNVVGVVTGHAHTPAATVFAGRPLIVAPGVASTLNLPCESDGWVNESQGPGLALHVIENHRMTTHFRVLGRW